MKIIVINKDELENIPPLISVIYHLTNLGHNVHVITTGYKKATAEYFKEHNIQTTVVPAVTSGGLFGKITGYIKYRRAVLDQISNLEFDGIWIEGGNTILALGKSICKYSYILQISELYENSPRMFRAIKKVIVDAKAVVMPEYNRTVLYQIWFSLKKRPWVLPNIPAFLPSKEVIKAVESKNSDKLGLLAGKNVILYQGHIGAGRDLTNFAKAVNELGENYMLLLVGKDHNTVADLRRHCSNILHIPFIPAPDYLVFTMHSDIGILSYDPTSINNVYCAPNKLFEYASFGLPMLGNDIPGLKYMLEFYNAGVIVDETSVESIKRAIVEIVSKKDSYREHSQQLFNSFDNLTTVSEIIQSLNYY